MPINIKYRVDENGNKIDTPPQSREHDTPIIYTIPPRTVSLDGAERRGWFERSCDLDTYDWMCIEDRMEVLIDYIRHVRDERLYKQDKPFLNYIWKQFKEFYIKDPVPPVWRSVGKTDDDVSVYDAFFE